jgi:hypothetical protein
VPVLTDTFNTELCISTEALPLWNDAVTRYHRLDDDVLETLAEVRATAPEFCFGHAFTAALASHPRTPDPALARAAIADARRTAYHGTPVEQSFTAAAAVQVDRGLWASYPVWQRHASDFPGDLIGFAILVSLSGFNANPDYLADWDALLDRARDAAGDVTPIRDFRAWLAHEHGQIDEAHELADSVVSEDPRWASAAHAKAHAFYESADHAEGLRWIEEWTASVPDPPVFSQHLSWHCGLHELALGRDADTLPRYVREMSCPTPLPMDGALALWRHQLLGLVRGGEDPAGGVLTDPLRVAAGTAPVLFPRWTSVLGLAALGDVTTLRDVAASTPTDAFPGSQYVSPLASALASWVEGDAATAADLLGPLAPRFGGFGGSEAQRDLLHDTYVAVLADAGRAEDALAYAAARDAARPWQCDRRLLVPRPRRSPGVEPDPRA